MKAMNRFIILAFTTVIVIASNALSCFASDSNSFTRNTFVTVKVDESLIMAEGQQFASVKVVTHDIDNNRWNTGGKVIVTLYSANGENLWTGIKNGGDYIGLSDEHSVYRINLQIYQEEETGNILTRNIIRSQNNDNYQKCCYWSLEEFANCYAE